LPLSALFSERRSGLYRTCLQIMNDMAEAKILMTAERPAWLRKRLLVGNGFKQVEQSLSINRLHTICQEACCPNQGECFSRGVATFLIMGNVCTRDCRFCAVTSGKPSPPDPDEPMTLAEEVRELGLRFVVVTSVTRDDLADGGAAHFAGVIASIRRRSRGTGVEVLIPDFRGSDSALAGVVYAEPEVLNHNVETVPRLYADVRPQADYRRSVRLLKKAKDLCGSLVTKSGLMVGLGEKKEEIVAVMRDLRDAGCDIVTIGQYLRPSSQQHPVVEYIKPDTFAEYEEIALDLGFKGVASSPFVRSSYNAATYYAKALGG
jgi:lipoyl synthase